MDDSVLLTREDLRNELQQFLCDVVSKELQTLGDKIHKDVREGISSLVDDASSKLSPKSATFSDAGRAFPLPSSVEEGRAAADPSKKEPIFTTAPSWHSKTSVTSQDSQRPRQKFDDVVPSEPNNDASRAAWGNADNILPLPSASFGTGQMHTPRKETSQASHHSRVDSSEEQREGRINHSVLASMTMNLSDKRRRFGLKKAAQSLAPGLAESTWQTTVKRIVAHEYFDYAMSIALILNCITIAFHTNWRASNAEEGKGSGSIPVSFRVLQILFCVWFTVELTMRVLFYGRTFLRTEGWQWNLFDTVLVTFQIIDEASQVIASAGTEDFMANVGFFRMLRICRVVRLLRMVRLIPELKNMVYLICASMWSFVWAAVLIILWMCFFAVYFTDLYADLKGDLRQADPDFEDKLGKHWGSMQASVLSLYMAITGGDDWRNFIDGFEGYSDSHFLHSMVFAIYIAFATLVMLNLVTGVFVEGAQRIFKDERDSDLVKLACNIFKGSDVDANKEISWAEFEEHLSDPGMLAYFKAVEINISQASSLFKLLDVDESGILTVEEFVMGTMSLKGPARQVDLAHLTYEVGRQFRNQRKRQSTFEHNLEAMGGVLHGHSESLTSFIGGAEFQREALSLAAIHERNSMQPEDDSNMDSVLPA